VLVNVRFKDKQGIERQMRADGLFRFWIYKEGYDQLGCNDPELGWKTAISRECEAHHSTAYRSALCGDGCSKKVGPVQ